MKYVDEYRDPVAAKALLERIKKLAAKLETPLAFMEICGGHTHTIYRHGLEHLLPKSLELIHGPGCPVCVIPLGRIDDAGWLARQPGVIFATFGDMMRAPGIQGSLQQAKAQGCDIRFVYSPLGALQTARENPHAEVVLFTMGFETTAPSTAVALDRAEKEGIENFSIFYNHIRIEPPLRATLGLDQGRIRGLIGPGHVAAIVGIKAFKFTPCEYNLPVVVTGSEPLDILQAVEMLIKQYVSGRVAFGHAGVENQYVRVVLPESNTVALNLVARVFEHRDAFEWRGLGFIPDSGFKIATACAKYDAEKRFGLPNLRVNGPPNCQHGQVLTGSLEPWQCGVFGTTCTPVNPVGTCMVSPEGACAAYYNFDRVDPAVAVALVQLSKFTDTCWDTQ